LALHTAPRVDLTLPLPKQIYCSLIF